MKSLEVEVPANDSDKVEKVIEEYTEDITKQEIEKNDDAYVEFNLAIISEKIDELTEELKGITDLDRGELTIRVLEQSAIIEKGKEAQGSSESLSVQEMYSKAIGFSSFTKTSWMLIALASGIATFGMILENVIIIIGAMMIAPMLSPLIASSFGLVIGDRTLIQKSILYGAFSILFAIFSAFLLTLPIPTSSVNPLMELVSEPHILMIFLSLFVGSAAALTFTTEARESLAGVAVAIALVPPSAVAGMSLAMLEFEMFVNVMIVLITNVTSIILAGSLTFKFFGVTPSTYYRKQISEDKMRTALIVSITSLLIISIPLTIISYQDYQNVRVQSEVNTALDNQLNGPVLSKDVTVTSSTVKIEIIGVNIDDDQKALRDVLENSFERDISMDFTSVSGNTTMW